MVFEESLAVSRPFDEVLQDVRSAFAAEGFGTLTEVDMQATLVAKIGKQMGRYVIIGACNPDLASRALDIVPEVGVLLPCNVVVRECDGTVMVEALDPGLMASMTGHDDIAPIAAEARYLVGNALGRLAATG